MLYWHHDNFPMKKTPKIIPLNTDSYLSVIKNSVGTKMFCHLYASVNGKKIDIAKNGELSCAFYASSVLVIFGLIHEIHATVDSTVRDLERSGWKKAKEPKPGSVIVWEKGVGSGKHKHIGFCIGKNSAVSNNFKKGYPIVHDLKKKNIEQLYWNPKIGQ